MCGICGVVELDRISAVDKELLMRMVAAINHRGPDDNGVYVNKNVGLGHARLSIIDLTVNGQQPMASQDGNYQLVFNGEIYNYNELYKELKGKGYSFKSKTDTEVIVNLWAEYGVKSLDRLEGMFAFAVWDNIQEELFLVRDRMGQKPLFYALQNGRFYFASEVKAILQDSRFEVEADLKSIQHYLTYRSVPAPMSAFSDVKKLEGGDYLRLDVAGNVQLHKYWQMSYKEQFTTTDEEELQDIVVSELKRSIKMRLMSDVPLGAFLSGGVDSSLVVALMAELCSGQVKTFSIGFDQQSHDETGYARMVSERYNTEHHEFRVTPDAASIFDDLVWHYNEPFADPSAIATYYLAKLAAEHVTVALTGDAGDENFGGYNRYYFPWGVANRCVQQGGEYLSGLIPWYNTVQQDKRFDWDGVSGQLDYFRYLYYQRFGLWTEERQLKLFTPEFWEEVGYGLPIGYMLRFFAQCDSADFFDGCTYFDMKHYIGDTLMTKVDIACMAFSLEARSPMLDHKFVEMACRIPARYKTRGGIDSKYILKKVASRYLPDEIVYRDKMGFGVPLAHWFRNDLKDMAYDTLLSASAIDRGYFNKAYIQEILDLHLAGRDQQYLIWSLLMLEEWQRMFIDKSIDIAGTAEKPWKVVGKGIKDKVGCSGMTEGRDGDTGDSGLLVMHYLVKEDIVKGQDDNEYCYSIPESIVKPVAGAMAGLGKELVVYEYYVPLGYAGARREDIAKTGLGRYSVEDGVIYFSASDNSDPRNNRHCYTFTISEAVFAALAAN